MPNRLTPHMDLEEARQSLAKGSREALAVLTKCLLAIGNIETTRRFFDLIDKKRLYDERIGELFKACGSDVGRFIYHIDIELPNQETGEWFGFTGPHSRHATPRQQEARCFGRPNSFWALRHPPTDPNYEYPINR